MNDFESAALEQLEDDIYETVLALKEVLDRLDIDALPTKMSTDHFFAACELRPIKDTINMLYKIFEEGGL